MILVVGATGQLGGLIVDKLVAGGREVRALIRAGGSASAVTNPSLHRVPGDLRQAESMVRACSGVDTVIATASSIVPRKGDRFGEDERVGYRNLIAACQSQGVRHVIYISAFSTPQEQDIPEFRVKREVEDIIAHSGIDFTIFRAAAFMDIYFATLGSSAVRVGSRQATLNRGFWLTRIVGRLTDGLIERHGLALVPGSGHASHAFIAMDDVAQFMANAVGLPCARNRVLDIGGPEPLSWREVIAVFSQCLGRRVRGIYLPLRLLRGFEHVFERTSAPAANLCALMGLLGATDHHPPVTPVAHEFGVELTPVSVFVKRQLARAGFPTSATP